MGLRQPRDGPQKQVGVGKGSGAATAAESQGVLKVMNASEISYQKGNSWIFEEFNYFNVYRVKKAFLVFQVHLVKEAFLVQKGLQGHRDQR